MTVRELFSDTVDFDDLEQPIRQWPVVVEVTTTYVVWTEGDTYGEAIDACKRDSELYEAFKPDAANGAGWEVIEHPSPWQYEPEWSVWLGPRPQCPDCQRIGEVGYQSHEYTCQQYVHTVRVAENRGQWRAYCWCTLDKFEWRSTEAEAQAELDRHVAGRQWKPQS